jgi:hypothetical protein
MLRELIERPLLKRHRTCESCGSEFSCEIGLKGCWCTKVDLTKETRADLADRFKDCLCSDCLMALSTAKQEGLKMPEGL